MKEYVGSAIPDIVKQWHTKPVGAKVCPTCQCDNVRAGVRHRIREDETGYWYEKIIKVCFGTDTSIFWWVRGAVLDNIVISTTRNFVG